MNALDQLRADHELILQTLNEVEKLCEDLKREKKLDLIKWKKFIQFVREFADGLHHHKEERFLFPSLHKAGLPIEDGPIGCMLHEHDMGRKYIQSLEKSLNQWNENNIEVEEEILSNTFGYLELLRNHIQKENQILFVMADQMLSDSEKENLKKCFNEMNITF